MKPNDTLAKINAIPDATNRAAALKTFQATAPVSTIPVANLTTPTPTVTLPTPPKPTINPQVQSQADTLLSKAQTMVNQPEPVVPQKTDGEKLAEQFGIKAPEKLTDAYTSMFGETPVSAQELSQKKQTATQLSNEMMASDKAFRDRVTEIRKNPEGKFGGAVEAEVRQAQSEYDNDRANKAIAYNVALGDYQGAKEAIDTLFSLKTKDIENQYKYDTNLSSMLYERASDEQKAKLDEIKTQKAQDFELKKMDIQYAREKELKNLTGGAGTKRDTSWQEIGGQKVLVDNQTGEVISKGQSQISNLEFAQNKGADKIEQLNQLIGDKTGLNASAGGFRLFGLANRNKVMDWRAQAQNVVSRLTMDELGRVKADGVTFGALSDSERKAVGDAATVLSAGMITETSDGVMKPTGSFKISEALVKKSLEDIKKYAEIDFKRRTGQSYDEFKNNVELNGEDLNQINNLMGVSGSTTAFNPANFY